MTFNYQIFPSQIFYIAIKIYHNIACSGFIRPFQHFHIQPLPYYLLRFKQGNHYVSYKVGFKVSACGLHYFGTGLYIYFWVSGVYIMQNTMVVGEWLLGENNGN